MPSRDPPEVGEGGLRLDLGIMEHARSGGGARAVLAHDAHLRHDGSFDGLHDIEQGDPFGGTGQAVPAPPPGHGSEEARAHEVTEHLRQEPLRHARGRGDAGFLSQLPIGGVSGEIDRGAHRIVAAPGQREPRPVPPSPSLPTTYPILAPDYAERLP